MLQPAERNRFREIERGSPAREGGRLNTLGFGYTKSKDVQEKGFIQSGEDWPVSTTSFLATEPVCVCCTAVSVGRVCKSLLFFFTHVKQTLSLEL